MIMINIFWEKSDTSLSHSRYPRLYHAWLDIAHYLAVLDAPAKLKSRLDRSKG